MYGQAKSIKKAIGEVGIAAVIVESDAAQAYETAMDIVGIKGQIIVTGVTTPRHFREMNHWSSKTV